MGIPRTQRGRLARERILEAAAELVLERGCHGTSLDDILKRADASKSQLYHYFRNKEDLMARLLQRRLEQLQERDPLRQTPCDSWERLEAWLQGLIREYRSEAGSRGSLLAILAAEVTGHNDTLRQVLVRAFEDLTRPVEDGLLALAARGEVPPGTDPRQLARFLLSSIHGAAILARTLQDPRLLDEAGHRLAAILRSLRQRTASA